MAKIKYTKTELKAQNDSLRLFQRFLPMLQLKKQQLQVEIATISSRIEEVETQIKAVEENLTSWIAMFSEPIDADSLVTVDEIITSEGNIAGVEIPIFDSIKTSHAELDLFQTPSWLDEAQQICEKMLALRAEITILKQQRVLIKEELRVTSQRVNLFEKVKIPECKENVRVIKIYLGDEQTSAVARGKIAKKRSTRKPVEDEEVGPEVAA